MVNRQRARQQRGISEYTSGGMTGAYFNPYEANWDLLDICDMRSMRWMKSARCISEDPEQFFEGDHKTNREHLRQLCRSCPVIAECLDWAIENDERGFWGGLSRRERRSLVAARARQPEAFP